MVTATLFVVLLL